MAVEIPERGREILEKPSIGSIATLMPDGAPHVTPVWVDVDGDTILVNTLEDRLKARNVRRDTRFPGRSTNGGRHNVRNGGNHGLRRPSGWRNPRPR